MTEPFQLGTAPVFITTDGHRFLTKRAALKRAAVLVLQEKYGACNCEGDGYSEPIETCEYHQARYSPEFDEIYTTLKTGSVS